jgi:hypothetical protein
VTRKNREKLNSKEVVIAGRTVTIRALTERELLEFPFDARLAGTSKNGPPWDKAEDLLFDKGLRDAQNVAGDRDKECFRFLIRFSVTFPEYKKSLSRDVLRAYLDNSTKAEEREKARDLLKIAAMQQPLCTPETLRFLRAYLEGDDPLWKLSLSQCAVRMGWVDYQGKPDCKRVRDILREYGIAHGMKGKPGRPRKK